MNSFNPPEIRYQYLSSLGITSEELHEQHRLASALIDSLDKDTLSSIRNAFFDSTITSNAGELFINIDKINILLRTGNSGAEHIHDTQWLWQVSLTYQKSYDKWRQAHVWL